MKKIISLFLIIISSLIMVNVKAICYDEELNEWSVGAQVLFQEDTREQSGGDEEHFAYFLSVTPVREDIKIKVTDGYGDSVWGKTYVLNLNDKSKFEDFYGVGCYTNLEEETYTIEVYGGDESACPNELLKTLKYSVPQYNEFIKTAYCDDYPDHELCASFTNKTKYMTEKEFNDILGKYDREIKEKELTASKIFKIAVEYGVYVLVPLVIISIFYIIKMLAFKRKERNK